MSAKDTHLPVLYKLTVSFALRNINSISHKCPLCFVINRHQHPSSLCFQHNQLSTDNVVCDICFYSDVETRSVLVCLPGGSTRFGTKDDSVHDVFVAFGTAPGAIQPSLFFAWETFNRLPSLSLRYHIRNWYRIPRLPVVGMHFDSFGIWECSPIGNINLLLLSTTYSPPSHFFALGFPSN